MATAIVPTHVGLALLWVTKTVVGIEGDAVLIALLLVPFVVYLAMTGELECVSWFGASPFWFRTSRWISPVPAPRSISARPGESRTAQS